MPIHVTGLMAGKTGKAAKTRKPGDLPDFIGFRGRGVPQERALSQPASVAVLQGHVSRSPPASGRGFFILTDRAPHAIQPESDAADGPGRAVLLVARYAFAAAPHRDMQRLAHMASLLPGVGRAAFCFAEQGTPSLREALLSLREDGCPAVLIVPLMLPMEPSLLNWMTRSLRRWQAETPGGWPRLHLARAMTQSLHFETLLASLVRGAAAEMPITPAADARPEASLVPAQKHRVLVCNGPSCNSAGADAIWGHLRNEQERRKLRINGGGTMTAKTTCLGPCSLAPVVQIFPDGTWYGGVTEAAVDRIVEEHLLGGEVVEDLAYQPTGRKQRLRGAILPSLENENQETSCVTSQNRP